ncbi:NAD(P)-dependent oxidoreductase [Mongoliitalea daihaiensis]|uniref:NAD(P)-dependent oxidoreductase n=1 Tax=Mongoliitalea daihaiensis TaxID=2782006 RepID=UPI001F1BC6AC|nr:NAD(P)-dependent oxidoreductase [Mongoliitalea daihaiensis]UJP64440.1 phosphoglycerate dehydrogenase [Mongoliitalea daihaiensis]
MSTNRVLIIDEMHLSIISLLESRGWLVDYRPDIGRSEILEILGAYVGMIIRSKTVIDRQLIEAGGALKFIGRAGAGLDQIDKEFLIERNISLFHAAEGNMDAVAEHAIGGLLAVLNKLSQADAEVRKGVWRREANRGVELQGKTVGIIGFGNMGSAFAKRLQGFDVQVLAYDKYKSGFGTSHVQEVSLNHVFEHADILSIHVPLTFETANFLDQSFFRQFHKPIFFINTARGELVSFDTLNWAFDQGILKGAVLDVLENEKFQTFTSEQQASFARLADRLQVVFSPHVAGWTVESYEKINQVLVQKISQEFNY